jgi:hypothetical protein
MPRGREAIGWHLSVYWKDDKQFYKGQVSDYDPTSDKHQVCVWGGALTDTWSASRQEGWGGPASRGEGG